MTKFCRFLSAAFVLAFCLSLTPPVSAGSFPALTVGGDYFTATLPTTPNTYCKGSTAYAVGACVDNYFLNCYNGDNDPSFSCLPDNDPAYVNSNYGCSSTGVFCVLHFGVNIAHNYSGTACSTGYIDQNGNCTTPPPTYAVGGQDPGFCPDAGANALFTTSMNHAMCGSSAHLMQVSLNLNDTPVGYAPPLGPAAYMRLSYNHKEAGQPATFNYSNVGPKWTLNLTSFITDDPTTPGAKVTRAVPTGGFTGDVALAYNSTTGAFASEIKSGAVLVRIPATGTATSYELRFPDGTKHVFAKFDGASSYPRRVFLTQLVDPQGNALTFTYDGTLRITTITDAASRTTTLSYTNTNPLLVTRITDPFGRYATLGYDGSGRLNAITDVIGITSSFTYDTTDPTLIASMTTPYGTSSYTYGESDYGHNTRWLELTDPLGGIRRVEFRPQAPSIPTSPPAVPSGLSAVSPYEANDTYVWDEHAYPLAITKSGGVITAEDYTKAQMTHWLTDANFHTSPTPGSVKQALENPVYFNYAGQANYAREGTSSMPTAVGQTKDSGGHVSFTYNALNNPLTVTDGAGRVTTYTYAANNIDVATVKQGSYTVAQYGSYNSQHEPGTYTDAAGQVTSYAYNTAGQKIYETNALNQTRFWEYDTYGRATRITVPVAVAFGSVVYGTTNTTAPTAMAFTYDSYDRVLTRTDSQGYVLTYTYDALDRLTKITYPDTSHDDYDWTFQSGTYVGTASLDIRKVTDRLGRVTTYAYDANRNVTSVTEPIDSTHTRTTSYAYWENGVLKSITDANGAVTRFDIDVQGRPTVKTYAYGTGGAKTETTAYETTSSRIKTFTDALSQVKTYTYGNDDLKTQITYTASVNATPTVYLYWDTVFPRLTQTYDGIGYRLYSYVATGTNGALQLASSNDYAYWNAAIAYTYDAVGRISTKTITGGNESYTYDVNGRLSTHTNGLGTFTYGYLGNTNQINSRTLNGTSIGTSWSYDTNTNDRKLTGITNSGVTRSYSFSYDNNAFISGAKNPYAIGGITDTAAATHPWATQSRVYTYDLSDRLLTASATTPGNSTFVYDKLNNPTTWTDSSGTTNPTFNAFNQISTWGAKTYVYDANGNTTSGDGAKTYKYDAEDRLIEIDYVGGTDKTVFTYDNLGHRIVQAETVSGTTTTTHYLWCGDKICQTRTGADVVTRRDYDEGEQNVTSGQKLIYMPDQLSAVRDVIDATTGGLVKAYDYSPYGAIVRNSGSVETDYRYAGMFYQPKSALNFSTTRAFDGATGRFINRDTIRENGGINLYGYGDANPPNRIDPSGKNAAIALCAWEPWLCPAVGVAVLIGACAHAISNPGPPANYTPVPVPQPVTSACVPPAGTICYFLDEVPPSKPHWPFPGNHYHLFQHNQLPDGTCRWNPAGVSDTLPAGAIPCSFPRA